MSVALVIVVVILALYALIALSVLEDLLKGWRRRELRRSWRLRR